MAKARPIRPQPRAPDLSARADTLFDRHASEISVRLGWFFLRHLHDIYQSFRGDFLLAVVLGEIAHHNICHYYSSGKPKSPALARSGRTGEAWAGLQPCNAFSLSTATGIPRETCRRKVQALVGRGWVERHPGGGYVITRQLPAHFRESNRRTFRDTRILLADLEAIIRDPGPS